MAGRAGKAVKWVLGLAAGLLALLLVVGIGGFLLLQTPWGGRMVRDFVVPRVSEQIGGSLDVGGLRFRGNLLVLEDVVLRDPEGRRVAFIDRVRIRFSWLPLLRQRIELESVEVRRPELDLRQDARGFNLARALDRDPTDAEWEIVLDRLEVEGGRAAFRKVPTPESPGRLQLRLEQISVTGEGAMDPETESLGFAVDLSAQSRLPPTGPVSLTAEGRGEGELETGRARLTIGDDVRLDARLRAADHLEVDVERLRLPPALVRGLAPDVPLAGPVTARGEVALLPDRVRADLGLLPDPAAGGGELQVRGSVSYDRPHTPDGLHARAREVDVAGLLGRPGRLPISFRLDVEAGSLRPADLTAAAQVDVPRAEAAGHTWGPIALDARVAEGTLVALDANARVPGTRLTAQGGPRPDRPGGAARGRLTLSSLGRARGAGARPVPGNRRARARGLPGRGGAARRHRRPRRRRGGSAPERRPRRQTARGRRLPGHGR
jgi:hypothetical protein